MTTVKVTTSMSMTEKDWKHHTTMKKGQFMFPVQTTMKNRSIHVFSTDNYEK